MQFFLRGGICEGVPLISNTYNVDSNLLNSFLGVLLGDREKKSAGLVFLISRLKDLSKKNKNILKSTVEAYCGNLDHYLSILEYSSFWWSESVE
jgi:hypothetical protein